MPASSPSWRCTGSPHWRWKPSGRPACLWMMFGDCPAMKPLKPTAKGEVTVSHCYKYRNTLFSHGCSGWEKRGGEVSANNELTEKSCVGCLLGQPQVKHYGHIFVIFFNRYSRNRTEHVYRYSAQDLRFVSQGCSFCSRVCWKWWSLVQVVGFSTSAGKWPWSNLSHAMIVSFLRKNVETISLHVNRIHVAIKRLLIICWQLTVSCFFSPNKHEFHSHVYMTSIFVLLVCSEAAQVSVRSSTSAGTLCWDRGLPGIDGIRDYSESQDGYVIYSCTCSSRSLSLTFVAFR